MPGTSDNYIISGGKDGKSRLKTLSETLYLYTKSLLEAQGLTSGKTFLDLGCGGGDVSFMAAEMAGPTSNITAVDFDEEILSLAQQEASNLHISNIRFQRAGAYDIKYNNEFDIAYARFLLSHLTEPATALALMVKSVKPGGKVIVEDLQFSGHFCYPYCEAFEKYIQYYTLAATHNGHHPEIGLSLFTLFREAGLKDVGVEIIQPCFHTGQGKWMAYITLDRIKDTLVKQGIATMPAIQQILQELEAFTLNETTIISLPRIFRVWGTKE